MSIRTSSATESFGEPVAGSLSTVIRSYKYSVTREIWAATHTRAKIWQGRVYDHVIRNDAHLNRIRDYVINNPAWGEKINFIQNDFEFDAIALIYPAILP